MFIREVIYDLKRSFGLPLDIVSVVEPQANLETGVAVPTKVVYHVRRAILLPRTYEKIIPLTRQNREFNVGGYIQRGYRVILLDPRDWPTAYRIGLADYCNFQSLRYNIKEVIEFDLREAYSLIVEEHKGESPRQIIEKRLSNQLGTMQEVESE